MLLMQNMSKRWALCVLGAVPALLVGCGGSNSSQQTVDSQAPIEMTTLSGTVAIGAPLVAANISLNCHNNWGQNNIVLTNNNGQWSVKDIPVNNLPCLVRASGGMVEKNGTANTQALYSLSLTNQSIVNITPLTTLALAKAANQSLENLFIHLNIDFTKLSSQLSDAIIQLQKDLIAQGYTYPGDKVFNPVSSQFSAQSGNSYDDLLEELQSVMTHNKINLSQLIDSYISGQTLPKSEISPNTSNLISSLNGRNGAVMIRESNNIIYTLLNDVKSIITYKNEPGYDQVGGGSGELISFSAKSADGLQYFQLTSESTPTVGKHDCNVLINLSYSTYYEYLTSTSCTLNVRSIDSETHYYGEPTGKIEADFEAIVEDLPKPNGIKARTAIKGIIQFQ